MREWMTLEIHCLSCSAPAMTMILCMRFLCSARFRSMEALSPVIRHMAPKQSVSISFHRTPPVQFRPKAISASHALWIGTPIKNVIWLNAFFKNSSGSEESSHVMINWMFPSPPSFTLLHCHFVKMIQSSPYFSNKAYAILSKKPFLFL